MGMGKQLVGGVCALLLAACSASEEASQGSSIDPAEATGESAPPGAPLPPRGHEPSGHRGTDADGSANGAHPDLGQGDGKDVVTMGDSYMKTTSPIGTEVSLEKLSGRDYRNYGNTGGNFLTAVAMLNGVIPNQLTVAKAAGATIETVVIAAGANDLTNDCNGAATEAELNAACLQRLSSIDSAIDGLIGQMAMAGVKDVVWVGYGDITAPGKLLTGALDHLRASRMQKCVAHTPSLGLRCHYVDTKAALAGKLGSDGAHPSAAGFDVIGQMVWDRMKLEGVRR